MLKKKFKNEYLSHDRFEYFIICTQNETDSFEKMLKLFIQFNIELFIVVCVSINLWPHTIKC